MSHPALLRMIRSILYYRSSHVCKHSVCLDILNEMEKEGLEVTDYFKNLIKAIANADDACALELLNNATSFT